MKKHQKSITLMLTFMILLMLPLSAATLTVNAGSDINHTVTASNSAINLVGTATDSDDNIVKYEWFNGITLIGTGASRWYVLTEDGEHNLTFKVTDANANVASDNIIVTVNHENVGNIETVIVDAGVEEKIHTVTPSNRQIYLNGTTTVRNSNIISQEWFKDGVKILNGSSAWYTLVNQGEYSFEFRVTAEDGTVASDVMLVTVVNDVVVTPTPTLTANAGSDINHSVTTSNTAIHLVGTATDADDNIVKYEWFKGTTLIGTGASRWYILTEHGEHNLTFKVTDADGNVASDSMLVTVSNETVVNVLGISQTVREGCTLTTQKLSQDDHLLWEESCGHRRYVYIKNTKIGDPSVRTIISNAISQDYIFDYLSSDYFIVKILDYFDNSMFISRVDGLGGLKKIYAVDPASHPPTLLNIKETNDGFFASTVDENHRKVSCVYYDGENFKNETMITDQIHPNSERFDTSCGPNGTFRPEAFNSSVQYLFNIENNVNLVEEGNGSASSSLTVTDTSTGEKVSMLSISNPVNLREGLVPEVFSHLIYSSDTYYAVTKEYKGRHLAAGREGIMSIEFGKFTGENKSQASLEINHSRLFITRYDYAETDTGLYLIIKEQDSSKKECIHFNPLTSEVSRETIGEDIQDTKCGVNGIFTIN